MTPKSQPISTRHLPLQVVTWRFAIYSSMWETGYHCPWMHILPTDVPRLLTYTFGFACQAEQSDDVVRQESRHHHRAFHMALKVVEQCRPFYVQLSPYAMQVVLGQVRIGPEEVESCLWEHSCVEHCCDGH